MNHRRGSFLPQRAVVAAFVFVEVGADVHLLCTIATLARAGRNNASIHTSGIPSTKVLVTVTSLRHSRDAV